jgi:hypothetical protein
MVTPGGSSWIDVAYGRTHPSIAFSRRDAATQLRRWGKRCNNHLGRIEAELTDWRDDAFRRTSGTSGVISWLPATRRLAGRFPGASTPWPSAHAHA